MVQLNFDARTVEPSTGMEAIPAGWYNVAIDDSEMKPTKDGLGAYLQLRFNILDGQYINRKLFARLNLHNQSVTAKEIAYRQLSAIGHAVGVLQIANSEQLHGLPMKVRVKIRKDPTQQYDDQNDITDWQNINAAVGGAAAAPSPVAPPQQGWAPPPIAAAPAPAPVQPQPTATPAWTPPAPNGTQPPATQAPAQTWQPPAAQPWQNPQPAAQPAQPAQPTQPTQPNPQTAPPPWQR
jgi:hypothetical protein